MSATTDRNATAGALADDWPGDGHDPLTYWVHCLIGGTDAFAFVTMAPNFQDFREALTEATAHALGLPATAVTVKACRVAMEPPF
jgi:hypothetical protein